MDRESMLFYTILIIFFCTAVVTLLGIIQKVTIERKYLNALFGSLLLELVAAVLYLFSSTSFFDDRIDSNEVALFRTDIPQEHSSLTRQQLVTMLENHDVHLSNLQTLSHTIEQQQPSYAEITLDLNEKIQKLDEFQIKNNELAVYKDKYTKLEKNFLVRMANLNSKLPEWGTSINLRWQPEEKKVIARMLQEAFHQIGFMPDGESPNDDPEKAHQLLVAYQKEKDFGEVGFLTSDVIALIIKDYLS